MRDEYKVWMKKNRIYKIDKSNMIQYIRRYFDGKML